MMLTHTRSRGTVTAIFLGVALFAAPGLANAGITPPTATIEVKAGATGTETKTVTVPKLPANADLVIAIDTNGSMGAAIAQARSQATALVNSIHTDIPDANFAVVDFKDASDGPAAEYNLRQSNTNNATAVQSAINAMTADGGGDFPKAQNLLLSKAATDDPALWCSGSRRFVVLITDAPPHDADTHGFPACNDFTTAADPHGLATDAVVAALKAKQTTLFAVTADPSVNSCYAAITAASFSGSVQAPLGTDLSTQLKNLITAASGTVSDVHLGVVPPNANASWISFTPASAGPVSTPATLTFTVSIAVPAGTAAGSYAFDIVALADGGDIGHQALTVTVPSSRPGCTLGNPAATVPKSLTAPTETTSSAAVRATTYHQRLGRRRHHLRWRRQRPSQRR
jgi:von Willebrand factor type A domain-containing protein